MTTEPADRIVQATLDLIVEHGIAGVTMTAIARDAGVARQTLYNHYPDVESIVYAAVAAHQQDSLDTLVSLLATVDSPTGRLEHLVRHTAAVAAHGHSSFKQGFSPRHQELIAKYDRGVRSLVATALQDGMESGEFRTDLEPANDSVLVQRMIEATGEIVADNPANTAQMVTAAVNTVLAAVHS